MAMAESVGVRDLKAHLSEYLKRVEGGGRLTVTDRGRPIAVITPIERAETPDWAYALVARGGARWSGGKPAGLAARVKSRGVPASTMVLEDRR